MDIGWAEGGGGGRGERGGAVGRTCQGGLAVGDLPPPRRSLLLWAVAVVTRVCGWQARVDDSVNGICKGCGRGWGGERDHHVGGGRRVTTTREGGCRGQGVCCASTPPPHTDLSLAAAGAGGGGWAGDDPLRHASTCWGRASEGGGACVLRWAGRVVRRPAGCTGGRRRRHPAAAVASWLPINLGISAGATSADAPHSLLRGTCSLHAPFSCPPPLPPIARDRPLLPHPPSPPTALPLTWAPV